MKKQWNSRAGMSLIEILVVMGMIAVLTSMAVARYVNLRCKAKSDDQLTVIQGMKNKIDMARSLNGVLPDSADAAFPDNVFPPGSEGNKLLKDKSVIYVSNVANYTYEIYFAEESCLIAGQHAGADETENGAKVAVWP